MAQEREFLTGVLEGFYGRAWSFQTRVDFASYLAQAGLNACLYCPKSDPFLRKQWQRHWPARQWRQLQQLSAVYREQGVAWGVGLSPFALYQQYGRRQRDQLERKIAGLAELEAPLLAILFDDMPGDLDALAARQAEIVADVVAWLPGVRVMICPTYYSFDPVLEKFFGAMPRNYWSDLGRALPDSVDIFWTGNRVCSESITRADLERIHAQLRRPVILWDNYPVNDGAVRSNCLYLDKLSGREALPSTLVSGHLCNAMNQGLLSLPALLSLAELYDPSGRGRKQSEEHWLEQVMGKQTWRQLQADREDFKTLGLSGLGESRCRELARRYRALPGPAAAEVAAWLQGRYRFDPACLTD